MQITSNTHSLVAALKRVAPVAPSRATMPILSCVLLTAAGGVLTLRTSNLDQEIELSIAVSVAEAGSIAVPVRRLLSIVRELSSNSVQLSIEEGDSKLLIESGSSRFNLFVQRAEDFPAAGKLDDGKTLTLDQDSLSLPIANVIPSASKDENRYILNGLFLSRTGSEFNLVSTDGRRLSEWKFDLKEDGDDFKAIVPTAAMQQVDSLLGIGSKMEAVIGSRAIRFVLEVGEKNKDGFVSRVVIQSKLVEGNYPNYKAVFPKDDKHFRIDLNREQFIAAVSRAKLILGDKSYSIKLSVEGDELSLIGSSSEFGVSDEKMKLHAQHASVQVALNPDFVLDSISGLECPTVGFMVADEISPVVFKDETGAFTSVVMPLRLS